MGPESWGSNWLCGLERVTPPLLWTQDSFTPYGLAPQHAGEWWSRMPPAYLVALHVAGVGEVDDGGKVVYMGAAEATPEEVVCQQGADVGLAGACPAMQGEDQWLGRGWVLHKDLQCLHHQCPGQVLAGQVLGQVTLQT